MNAITLTGNVANEPELRFTADGRPVANFSMGNSERVGTQDFNNGFFDITVWGKQAEHVVQTLSKGDRIVVTDRLQQTNFEREDGSRSYRVRVTAAAVALSLEFAAAKVIATEREEVTVS